LRNGRWFYDERRRPYCHERQPRVGRRREARAALGCVRLVPTPLPLEVGVGDAAFWSHVEAVVRGVGFPGVVGGRFGVRPQPPCDDERERKEEHGGYGDEWCDYKVDERTLKEMLPALGARLARPRLLGALDMRPRRRDGVAELRFKSVVEL